ncbi:hypothetical protein [Streptomyces alkaliphilus]|uniref:hypothetical protein n=1 Tax=Streptomyces alkaliphilus TaxID=1472722 RepID=UPI0011806606|nr:hypothetical protein [Streptomyces alkaliphilus]MQS05663.1 hypothetical protein [Streptomyces alkaliphilus]
MTEPQMTPPGASSTPPEYDLGPPSAYDDYVRFSVAVQALPSPLPDTNPDSLLFQTVHLQTEFAWYTIHHELGRAANALAGDDFAACARLVRRATAMQRHSTAGLELLDANLDQRRFLALRKLLPDGGSGLDSPGYRNLRPMTGHLWREFERACERLTIEVERIAAPDFGGSADEAEVASVTEALLALDKEMIRWQHFHIRLVWSKLGGHPSTRRPAAVRSDGVRARSITGRTVDFLDGFAKRVNFPRLWELVDVAYNHSHPVDSDRDHLDETGNTP